MDFRLNVTEDHLGSSFAPFWVTWIAKLVSHSSWRLILKGLAGTWLSDGIWRIFKGLAVKRLSDRFWRPI